MVEKSLTFNTFIVAVLLEKLIDCFGRVFSTKWTVVWLKFSWSISMSVFFFWSELLEHVSTRKTLVVFVLKDRFNMCSPTQLLSCFIFTLFTGVSGSFMHRFIMFFQVTMMIYLFHNFDRCVLFPSTIMIWLFWSS